MRSGRSPQALIILMACAGMCGCGDEPTTPKDATPPAAVADLVATDATTSSIVLTWTAPGDDGANGRAALYDVRQLNGPITDENWNLALAVNAELGYPRAAGEAETLVVRSLVPGLAYSFALRAADESANWSALSNTAALSTLDAVPPAAVTDLAVRATTDSSVTLSWTAPGDDGSVGQASSYDLRYALEPITEQTWGNAVRVSNPPLPSGGGFSETFELTGLAPLITYSFALRAEDDSHNVTALSNVVQARTPFTIRDPSDLVDELRLAYGRRDFEVYSDLFPGAADAAYLYFGIDMSGQPVLWDAVEELRIHRRMFRPEDPLPGEPPVPPDLWPQAISISLAPVSGWVERPDLYRSPSNPEGLDPARWRAAEAQYHASLLWDMQGETDYRVDGRQNFVVIEDLNLGAGEDGKFRLYRWEDLGAISKTAAAAVASWTQVKSLYR